ncbi:DUF916 and DUF3324 domain-containing protein [Vagococcus xieshaowenii]|uniref:DUF916 and DUF3324 domain-containing protein n=1 Tax=Vagococcus xieshaowenii TaxID=2562451 RepID=A0AAJ5EGI5_9ENTE|nr:DUF916 and DUF3324 domain-containing protein [Vagococcus xieshaowenii]QCA28167.1 DUF916 and DUF3324 domain-containing protein [Vagococcus xieshaowenii]TFZ42521.1 DUF916 and DUF3324 domain-containing protein [Vagococcus xieshaowenii]
MKKLIGLMVAVIGIGVFVTEEVTFASSGANFSVQPKIPENQKSSTSYFDLELKPNEKQTVEIEVFNDSNEEIEVIPELNRATTSDVGNINYLASQTVDDSLIYNIEEFVTNNVESITLAPKESEVVKWQIQMPKEAFEGILLGGFRFSLAEGDKEVTGIENRFAYTVGIVLSNSEEDIPVNLNLNDITTGQINYRNHVLVNLQNDMPRIIDDMAVEAKIYEKNSENPVFISERSQLRMAPNSSFNYGISTQETAFKPGSYTLELTANADGEEFSWRKDFEISNKEAKEHNKEAILIEDDSNNLWMWIAIAAVIVSVSIVIWTTKKRTNERKEDINEKNN